MLLGNSGYFFHIEPMILWEIGSELPNILILKTQEKTWDFGNIMQNLVPERNRNVMKYNFIEDRKNVGLQISF